MTPAVRKSWLMDWVNELAAIPSPLRTPPSMTVHRQPSLSTSMLQKGPVEQVEYFHYTHGAERLAVASTRSGSQS